MSFLEIKTATDNFEEAKKISGALVKCHLVACAQIIKINSSYFWKENFENTDEFLVIMKTTNKNKKQVCNFIKTTHSYELPEIVCTKILCSKEYGNWIKGSTKKIYV